MHMYVQNGVLSGDLAWLCTGAVVVARFLSFSRVGGGHALL